MNLVLWISFTAIVLFVLHNRVQLVDEWRAVLRHSASIRLAIGAVVLHLIENSSEDLVAVVPLLRPLIGAGQAEALSALLVASIPAARIWKQAKIAAKSAKAQEEEK